METAVKQTGTHAVPVVDVKGLSKEYRQGQIITLALQDLTFQVQRGEFVSISGPSGCGKSTLLHVLGLMDQYSSGHYQLAGLNTNHLNMDQRSQIRNHHIGFVFQAFNLIDSMKVFDNVALPLRHRGLPAKQIDQQVMACLAQVDMSHRADFYPSQLSGGQQQRVAIARAIVTQPDLLLVDEPTGNLDSKNGDAVMALLGELNRAGTTIIMVTHDSRYSACAHRTLQLLDGKLITAVAREVA
jgi:putative ABC transport system ATP-binding protein